MRRIESADAPRRLAEAPASLPGHLHVFEPDESCAELEQSGAHGAAVESLLEELRCVERFVEAGVDAPTRIMFDGPPGTGKTLTARWLGWRLRVRVVLTDISSTVASHLGETSKNLAEFFRAAASAKAILFLDEVDALCVRRDRVADGSAGAELARATSTLLQQLDWLPTENIVIAATNFADLVDPALARRLPTRITFALPDRAARLRMVQRWLARAPVPAEVLERLADESEGRSGSDLRAAAMACARRAIMASPAPPKTTQKKQNGISYHEGAQGVLGVLEGLS